MHKTETQSKEKSIEKFDKNFNCSVKLDRMIFKKIRIGCSAQSSEPGVNLSCVLKQVDVNTLSVKIKRKMCDSTASNKPKRSKIIKTQANDSTPIETVPIGIELKVM